MATGAEFTEAQLEELIALLSSGVRRVRFSGPPQREVEYQELPALRELLAQMRREVCGAPSRRLATHSKGFR